MRRSKYSQEFKDSTVLLIINNNESIVKASCAGETLDEGNKCLRKENKLLKQEHDILKKATAHFAKEVL